MADIMQGLFAIARQYPKPQFIEIAHDEVFDLAHQFVCTKYAAFSGHQDINEVTTGIRAGRLTFCGIPVKVKAKVPLDPLDLPHSNAGVA